MKRTLLVCAFAAALSAGLTAQSPKLTPAAPPTSGFVSLFEDEGTLWALGDDYRARFLSDGVEFTPLLGKLEPETRNLRLRLRATGRASGPAMGNVDRLQPIAAPGRCTWQELGVEVEHGGVREVYEVRSEGLKQSFVFAETPAGTGDLVVRVGLETNMNVGAATATGITFEGSRGGATIGVVVGFDAAGRTVEGTLALVGDELEMRLPAAFVETATAPITVDPLIGPTTTVDSGSEYYPDVAYSSGNDLWMVVWHRYVSSSDSDIRAQKLWADGTLYDVGVGVRTGTEVSQRPRIAYNRYQGTMVVAWEEAIGGGQRDIYARTVKLTTNPLGTVYTVSSFTDDEFDVDVGGNLGSVGASKDRIVVGWNRLDPNDPDGAAVWAKSFDVDGTSGVLTPNGLTTSVGAIHADARRISIADATPDRQAWMMVWDTWHVDWTTNTAWIDGARDLYCELYDTDLHGLGGGMTLVADGYSVVNGSVFWYQAGGAKCLEPSIAGDGNRWFVAYSLAEGLSGLPHSIAGAAIEYGGGVVSVPYAFRTIALGAGDQTGPSVAWMPNSVLVAYLDEPTSGVVDPWLWTGDFDCKQCGSAVQIASTGDCRQVRIASRVGGSTSYALDEALITYFDDSGATEAVIADRFRSDDGLFENIGGGCGSGTNVEQFSQCAVVGHADHVIHLLDAPADTAALLLLGFDPFSSQCGSCELKINPFEAFAFALTTDGNGEAIAPLPISQSAGLLGLSFYHQWLIDNPSTAGCAAVGSDFTDAIRVTIQ